MQQRRASRWHASWMPTSVNSAVRKHTAPNSGPDTGATHRYAAAGEDNGIDQNKHWLRFPCVFIIFRSHYLHPHPYICIPVALDAPTTATRWGVRGPHTTQHSTHSHEAPIHEVAPFLEGQAHPPPPRRVVEQKLGEATRSAACSHGRQSMIRTEAVTEIALRFCSFHLRCSQTDNRHPTNSTTPQLSPPEHASPCPRAARSVAQDSCRLTGIAQLRLMNDLASSDLYLERLPPRAASRERARVLTAAHLTPLRCDHSHGTPFHPTASSSIRECGCRWRRMGRRDYGNLGKSQSASYIMSTPGISTHA
jgi:hypothetical protein